MHGKHPIDSSIHWRSADAAQIAGGLQSLRAKTLAVFDAYVAVDKLVVPHTHELNPPLWELGHLAWFQEFWIGRNQQQHLGIHSDAKQARLPSILKTADCLYDSGTVPHDTRWHLALLEPDACKAYLFKTLEQTLRLLTQAGDSDDALYFYRLVLFHEAMHLEAAIYMAQALGIEVNGDGNGNDIFNKIAINNVAVQTINTAAICRISLKKQLFSLGSITSGFVFDNELSAQVVEVNAFDIDSRCVNWGEYLNFVEATDRSLPRYVRKGALGYEDQAFGVWKPLNLLASAVHLSLSDAQEYCAWAGRRLPTEAEWELAALTPAQSLSATEYFDESSNNFLWGEVWEWTSSTFMPYPGFVAHPYQDYSEPWFGTRQVLRGACMATQPMMKNAKYRNYFTTDRTDIYAGFRTCGL
jgi:gamma-glutamyl hercynylcysteine S-oxide synthase